VLKDPDYVSHYHRGTLALRAGEGSDAKTLLTISGSFRNAPERVGATREAVLESLARKQKGPNAPGGAS